jgi:plastocyanin
MKRLILLPALAALAAVAILVPAAFSASSAQTIRVTEVSYTIKLSAAPKAGTVKFVVRNASDDDHDFWLTGGGKTFRTRVLGEGRTASVTATLKKGVKYRYWCAVDDHRVEGMSGSFVAR